MRIKVKIEAVVNLEEGKTNINEITETIGNWSRQVGLDVCKGVIENYQEKIVDLLCDGKGESSWVPHKDKREDSEQLCPSDSFRRGGFRKKERVLKTPMGELRVKVRQIICKICDKRFEVLSPLLKMPKYSRATMKIKQMSTETVGELSYRRSDERIEGLAKIDIPKSTLHRWTTAGEWDVFTEWANSEDIWKSFTGIMADGTGYKRQKAKTTKGNLRIVMGVKDGCPKLVPLGVWADKSWEEIEKKISGDKPPGIKPDVLTVDGEKGQERLSNLTGNIQRCSWHVPHQLKYYLWKDGVPKNVGGEFIRQLLGIIKIEVPQEDYKEITDAMKEEIQENLKKSRGSVNELIAAFKGKGYEGASTYLENAAEHMFTVVDKWLEIGYMPPKTISILERTMREMGRRLKKIGASWKEKGVLAVANILLARIYTPEQWEKYWDKLLDIQGRCSISSYHIKCSVVP